MLAAGSKADWVLADGAQMLLATAQFGSCAGGTEARAMLMGRAKAPCRHTSARACIEHAMWSQVFGSTKRNRG
jgi:hypothetical protein